MARPTMGPALGTPSAPNLLAMRKSSAMPDVPMNSTVPISTMTERACLSKTASDSGSDSGPMFSIPLMPYSPPIVIRRAPSSAPVSETVVGERFSSANAAPG